MKHEKIDVPAVGVFEGISNADYHGGPGISKSGLDIIRRSPMHYKHAQSAERKAPTPDQFIGTLAHALILEPETFWDNYARPFEAPENAVATMDDMKSRLKELDQPVSGKKADLEERLRAAAPEVVFLDDAKAAHAKSVGDKEIVTPEQLEKAEAIRDAVMSHEYAGKLFAPGSGVPELSCYWRDPETGVLCRCRPDWWRHDGIVVDLKTAVDASPEGFPKSILNWRYHVQAAFYLDGMDAALEQSHEFEAGPKHFIFVAVEKTAPYAVAVYAIQPESLDIGRRVYREDLARYAECQTSEKWPGYGDKIQSIGLPEWLLRREEYENNDNETGVYVA